MARTYNYLLIFLLSVTWVCSQTQLTVYSSGQALVKEQFTRQLPAGPAELEIEEVAAALIPASVKLSANRELHILEQNYRYDLVNQDKLLKKYLGAEVTVTLQNDRKTSGKLLSFDNSALVLLGRSGTDILQRNFIGSIKCPTPSERLFTRPTLSWKIQSPQAGSYALDLSYLTENISWQAEYVAVIADDQTLVLSSWINLTNNSGKDYLQTRLKLVAGDLHRARPQSSRLLAASERMLKAEAFAPVAQRGLFEYHLYEIGFPVSVQNREQKQIQWLSPTPVQARRRYVFQNGGPTFSNLPVKISFTNDDSSGTGQALPAGIVRLFKKDTDGALELVGEDNLQHTSRGDRVSLELGQAFDIKGKREVLDRRSKSNRFHEEDIRITLANRKAEPVTIDVIQTINGNNWKIINPSLPYRRLDANTITFTVSVPAESEFILTYTSHLDLK